MGERLGEPGAGGDLQEDFRQIDTRHQVGHGRPQLQQRVRFLQLVQCAERQFGLALGVLTQLNRRVVRQAGGHRLSGRVQLGVQGLQGSAGVDGQAQRAADDRPRRQPFGTVEQAEARIGVAPTGRDEQVAAAERRA
ncbi:hypothetical protein D9M68_584220 [compost metagenome]